MRRLRLEANLTQEAMALESGFSRNHLIELEHGRRGALFERLKDLAVVLGVPTSALLDWGSGAPSGRLTAPNAPSDGFTERYGRRRQLPQVAVVDAAIIDPFGETLQ